MIDPYLHVSLVDLSRADNGNYTCEVRGASSRVLTNVTHEVIIQGEITTRSCVSSFCGVSNIVFNNIASRDDSVSSFIMAICQSFLCFELGLLFE